ncbi:hypothetical protein RHGRI_021785 [Rhododendron griersonianum]|uniref:K-box domain-containing protein n=1 Tax=Rhododendron griersonianum TaxID=479676 RepID=A0AAV6JPZ1_9ERIC|nr:hypothetical protein RHGRI_021785 [Rhododendron griersonianum]
MDVNGKRLHNQEYLHRALAKLKGETDRSYQVPSSPVSADSQVEELQQEILRMKSQLEDMDRRLRIFEGDPREITTLCEAQYREQILEETLKRVRVRRMHELPSESSTVHLNGFVTRNPNDHIMDWLPHKDPQIQIMKFLDSNGLLPIRYMHTH